MGRHASGVIKTRDAKKQLQATFILKKVNDNPQQRFKGFSLAYSKLQDASCCCRQERDNILR
jgi:hypothetical protein